MGDRNGRLRRSVAIAASAAAVLGAGALGGTAAASAGTPGGDDIQDRNVPILISLPGLRGGHVYDTPVETTQIALSILALLGLNPKALDAVRIEHTQTLPGLRGF